MRKIFSALLIVVALVAISALAPAPARADGPFPDVQPWMYAAAEYSGIGNVGAVQSAFKLYQDNQALIHQYTTPEQWQSNYPNDVTNFLHQHGCASCYLTLTESSFKLKIDVPVALRDFGQIVPAGL